MLFIHGASTNPPHPTGTKELRGDKKGFGNNLRTELLYFSRLSYQPNRWADSSRERKQESACSRVGGRLIQPSYPVLLLSPLRTYPAQAFVGKHSPNRQHEESAADSLDASALETRGEPQKRAIASTAVVAVRRGGTDLSRCPRSADLSWQPSIPPRFISTTRRGKAQLEGPWNNDAGWHSFSAGVGGDRRRDPADTGVARRPARGIFDRLLGVPELPVNHAFSLGGGRSAFFRSPGCL